MSTSRFHDLIANYHTHTTRCRHANGTARDYVESAIAGGLKILGFADHSPYVFDGDYYSGFRMKLEQTEDYVSSLLSLREEYRGKIDIYVGFEMEYYPAYFERTLEFLSQFDYDYLILGQHFIENEINAQYSASFGDNEEYLKKYADQCIEGMKTGAFSYLVHPDLAGFFGDEKIYRYHARRICESAAELNIPLELNLLGVRGNRHYPRVEFWEEAARVGNDVIFGVDAHDPAWLNDNEPLHKAYELVDSLGLNVIDKLDSFKFPRKAYNL